MSRTRFSSPESLVLATSGLLLLLGAVASLYMRLRWHPVNPRMAYGLAHLPAALFSTLAFLILAGIAWVALSRVERLAGLSSGWFLASIGIVFCLFWLPPLLAGGFDSDDWLLLAAALVRKSVMAHPWLAWRTLDSVDGNFRPLGTALYFGAMLRTFGVVPFPFLAGLFLFNLAAVLMIFPIVREMGYGKMTATAAALLYLSRSLTYTIETWTSALGDVLVILLCGSSALTLLRAIKRRGSSATRLDALAWVLFFIATFAKQSAFAFPLIAGLILFLRPGTDEDVPVATRLRDGLLGVAAYGAGAAIPYFHAKALTTGPAAYPLALSWHAATRTLAYAAWWVATLEFPDRIVWLRWAPEVAGAAVIVLAAALVLRLSKQAGGRPRDLTFCLLAALTSLSLFAVLATRGAAYYGSMAAFWLSMAVAITLTRVDSMGRKRSAQLVFCGLLVLGYLDIRLKQTGLLPSGGYTWGTSGSDLQGRIFGAIQAQLSAAPATRALLLTDMPGYAGYFTSMAMVADPAIVRIVTHQTREDSYFVNDLDGRVPVDGETPLNDDKAYNWTVPLDHAAAERVLASANGPVLRLRFHGGKIERED